MLELRAELEDATFARINALHDPRQGSSAEYVVALRSAAAVALDCGYAVLADGSRSVEVPPELLVQARLASRQGIPLHVVTRRYYAGYTLLNDFLLEEGACVEAHALHLLSRDLAEFFERLIDSVSEEHKSESRWRASSDRTEVERAVRGLLAGELVDHGRINYEFDAWHLAVVAIGDRAREFLSEIASEMNLRILALQVDRETAWGWFGRRDGLKSVELDQCAQALMPRSIVLSIGEQGQARRLAPISQTGTGRSPSREAKPR